MDRNTFREYCKYGLIFINRCVSSVSQKSLFFIPHQNCKNDNYDIINYKSDNVLCLFNDILRDKSYNSYKLNILYYDQSKLCDYKNYCKDYQLSRVCFILADDIVSYSRAFANSSVIFTDEMYRIYPLKSNKQTIVCLNYYAFPFKSDYSKLLNKEGKSSYLKEQRRINKYYDYLVSTSDMSSIFITQAVPFYYEHCVTLGFPRSDVFFQKNDKFRDFIKSIFPFKVDNIFIYVPTHRDYENPLKSQYEDNKGLKRTIWGNVAISDVNKLESKLEETNSVIIAKIHPIQSRDILKKEASSRIISYSDLSTKCTVSLNELMAISDAMITDYTSAVFDYLNINKPIIYYQYDVDKYNETRGFVINPMNPLCAGIITHNITDLIMAIDQMLKGIDDYVEKRKFLLDLIVTFKDTNSVKRIKEYFLENKVPNEEQRLNK